MPRPEASQVFAPLSEFEVQKTYAERFGPVRFEELVGLFPVDDSATDEE